MLEQDQNLTNGTQILIPSAQDQVFIFTGSPISSVATGNASYLAILLIGANDYFRAIANNSFTEALPGRVVDDIEKNIKQIIGTVKPRDLVVGNLPPIDASPYIQSLGPVARTSLSALGTVVIRKHNSDLSLLLRMRQGLGSPIRAEHV
ncbi:hypothetical protein HDU93_001992 [Gonapodya sp. JEL0774]|nr:hypothetical protein HDU93_001992 [Gonapodya sp. JEL0774]